MAAGEYVGGKVRCNVGVDQCGADLSGSGASYCSPASPGADR